MEFFLGFVLVDDSASVSRAGLCLDRPRARSGLRGGDLIGARHVRLCWHRRAPRRVEIRT